VISSRHNQPTRPLRVVQALGWYFPESSGGTEVYVEGLVRHLRTFRVESTVAAASEAADADYEWKHIPVHRYRVPEAETAEIRNGTPHGGFDGFARWLRAQDADIYHQHTWTRGCGKAHFAAAKALGLKTVLTVHVPGFTCLRGTMMLDGADACDGTVDVARCTRCWGPSRGIPAPVARWQARHPALSTAVARALPVSRYRTAFLTPELVRQRQAHVVEAAQSADVVVAVCKWLRDTLASNGVPAEKLVCSPQGADLADRVAPARSRPATGARVRIGFLGRWDPVKGVHILVDAIRNLPSDTPIDLFVYGIPYDAAYERSVRSRAADDARIHMLDPIGRADVPAVVAALDALAVPSVWLETGPLVALEALAAGTPVVGSNLGGIAEIVTDGVNGWLLPHGDVAAWTKWFADYSRAPVGAPGSIRTLPDARALPIRTMEHVAGEMSILYQRLCPPIRVEDGAPLAAHV
jgi:glycosyltransferase involved in cell wall biosynthesis